MSEEQKRQAAAMALTEIDNGMRLGLGTGSTARHFVELLGARIAEGLEVICVPTSEETAAQARGLNIPLSDLDTLDYLDITIDGADEIGPELALIKGGGGALLREKIVAAASQRMVVIADVSKIVTTLGKFALPIEVNRFGLGATRRAVTKIMTQNQAEGDLVLRLDKAGNPFVTDGGHFILDAFFGRILTPDTLSDALLNIPGVVQHGLFLGLCKRAYVATPDGVRTLND